MEVVLSDVDPRGELKSNAGFCFPAQIAHGAVLDLAQRGIGLIFLPHVSHMPQPQPLARLLSCARSRRRARISGQGVSRRPLPLAAAGFRQRLRGQFGSGRDGGQELGVSTAKLAEQAWTAAVSAQTEAEQRSCDLGRRALEEAIAAGKPAILLAGHSYNAFTPEASQSVGKKLSSMGVATIPADCLAPVGGRSHLMALSPTRF